MRSEIIKKYENLKKQQLLDVIASMTVNESPTINSPQECYHAALRMLPPEDLFGSEYFFTITLNGAHKIIDTHIISKGLVNRTLVHPREVFRPAILDNSTSIIIAHNHPSGNLQPSEEDKAITQRLKTAGEIIGIRVLDHLIFSSNGYLSMLEANEFQEA